MQLCLHDQTTQVCFSLRGRVIQAVSTLQWTEMSTSDPFSPTCVGHTEFLVFPDARICMLFVFLLYTDATV